MTKLDLKKHLKPLYSATANAFTMVDVPPLRFLMIDGQGDPNKSRDYTLALEALYSVAFTVKFASKIELGRDYVVPPLEGLWWANDMEAFITRRKDQWRWTMLSLVPDWISGTMIDKAIEKVQMRKAPLALRNIRHGMLHEGLCVQTKHIGPYDEEGPILARLHHDYLPHNKLIFNGRHHEIYLSDPRKTVAAKLKTILRQPVAPLKSAANPRPS